MQWREPPDLQRRMLELLTLHAESGAEKSVVLEEQAAFPKTSEGMVGHVV